MLSSQQTQQIGCRIWIDSASMVGNLFYFFYTGHIVSLYLKRETKGRNGSGKMCSIKRNPAQLGATRDHVRGYGECLERIAQADLQLALAILRNNPAEVSPNGVNLQTAS